MRNAQNDSLAKIVHDLLQHVARLKDEEREIQLWEFFVTQLHPTRPKRRYFQQSFRDAVWSLNEQVANIKEHGLCMRVKERQTRDSCRFLCLSFSSFSCKWHAFSTSLFFFTTDIEHGSRVTYKRRTWFQGTQLVYGLPLQSRNDNPRSKVSFFWVICGRAVCRRSVMRAHPVITNIAGKPVPIVLGRTTWISQSYSDDYTDASSSSEPEVDIRCWTHRASHL